ncbi:MAG: VPS10 domain-containing protein, partial [Clostridiales bacterium]
MQKKTALYFLLLFTSAFLFFQSVSFAQSSNWQQLASPFYEGVFSISAAPNGNLWTITGNIAYMSTDQGNTWKKMKSIPNIYSSKVAVNPYNGNIFIICGYTSIYRSTDNGQSWDNIFLGQDVGPVGCISFNPNGDIIAAAGYSDVASTIFVSSNKGTSWTKKSTMIDNAEVLSIAVTKSGNYVASTHLGIYRSADGGSTWTCVSQSLPKLVYNAIKMAKDGTLFTGTQSKIYSSTDDGQSWQVSYMTGSGLFVKSIVADSSGNVWACDIYGLYRTIDYGQNWFRVSVDLDNKGINDFTSDPSGNLFAGSQHGILMSTNAGNEWISRSAGINNSKCDEIKLAPDGTLYTYHLNDLYLSTNSGTSWTKTQTDFSPYGIECLSIDSKGNLYAGSVGRIGISTDRGNSWEMITFDDNSTYITSIAFDEDGAIYAGTGKGIYRSLNNGKTWNLLYGISSSKRTQIAISRNKDIFFAVNRAVYKSADNGATWAKKTPGIAGEVKNLMINHKGYIYFGTDNPGLLYSKNNGETWQDVQVGEPNYFPIIYSILEARSGIIYTNTTNGYYYSDNDGQTWNLIDKEEDRGGNILDMIVDKTGYLYATTDGSGFIKSNQPLLKILPPETINIKIGDQKAYLSWNKITSPNFSKYNIYGSYDHYPSTLINIATGGANDTTKLVNNLTNLKYYYMVISAVDNQGNESFSDEVSVKPIPLPAAPTQVEVANGLTKAKTTQSFRWTRPMCGDLYALEISQDSTFKTSFYSDSTLTDTVKQVGGFAHSTKYFWRVKSQSISGWGSWSNVWTFTTIIAPPSAPVAIQPSINALNQPVNETFKWNKLPTAESYYFQLSKAQDFKSSMVFEDSTLTDTLKAIGPLENDTKYYWRLRGKNEGGIGAWTTALSFATIVATPEVALLSSPLNNAQAQPRDITLKWLKAKRAGQYFFQLASDSLFNDLIISDSMVTDTCKTVMQLSYNSKYYWKVKSVNVGGVSLWSSVFSFIVM